MPPLPAVAPALADPRLHRASTAVRVKGVAMLVMAAIHTTGVFPTFSQASRAMPRDEAVQLSAWFAIAGIYFAFMGAVDLSTFAGLRRGERDAWRTALVSSVFGTLSGACGASWLGILRRDPGAVFPATIFLVGLVSLIALLGTRPALRARWQAGAELS